MNRTMKRRHLHRVGVAMAASLLLAGGGAMAQNSTKLTAQIIAIDAAEKKLTLKAVMGHKTMRVLNAALLEPFKVGDNVLISVGQDGNETIVTDIAPNNLK